MAPRYIAFDDHLPKTPTQKVEEFKAQESGNRVGTVRRRVRNALCASKLDQTFCAAALTALAALRRPYP